MNEINRGVTPAPHLTPTLREALDVALADDDAFGTLTGPQRAELTALRDACPERSTLEDGIYEVPDRYGAYYLRYVRDERQAPYRGLDGTLYGVGSPLPADVSGWRLIAPANAFTSE